ncbi:SKP1-like protein 1A [Canna indica]|uniref:SKP1-like protein 1A n=1 Tax=Canna indica TaxID=4628 RepID=A0AAQ3KP42_9LILI|nr:SKP1-like protein 1A [Canna indica]
MDQHMEKIKTMDEADWNSGALTGVKTWKKKDRATKIKVVLKTDGGQDITVDATYGKVAAKFGDQRLRVLKNGDVLAIRLPNHIARPALDVVVNFWRWQQSTGAEKSPEEIKDFAEASVTEVEEEAARLDVYAAANCMVTKGFEDVTPLLRAASQRVADAMTTVSAEQAREYLGLVPDFTEEEEKKLLHDLASADN